MLDDIPAVLIALDTHEVVRLLIGHDPGDRPTELLNMAWHRATSSIGCTRAGSEACSSESSPSTIRSTIHAAADARGIRQGADCRAARVPGGWSV